MLADANKGFSVATDLADYLVRNGVAFRDAHEITGKLVKMCEKKNIRLDELSLESMQEVGNMINKDVFDYLSVEGSVESRSHIGGTAKKTILTQLRYYRKLLANNL
jgi:argininosuccinate lyase